jgi:hypothetical protein
MWFRCQVKLLGSQWSVDGQYEWLTMSILSHWTSEQSQLICLGMPKCVQENIQRDMHSESHLTALEHPLVLLPPLLKEIALLYDRSVWRIRNELRNFELVSVQISQSSIKLI